jgi:transposase-like protein
MKRWTMKERRAILKEWESSEMTRKEFCKKHGISVSSLRHWKDMVAEKDNAPEVTDFIEVDSAPAVSAALTLKNSATSKKFFRITTSYGAVIEVPL